MERCDAAQVELANGIRLDTSYYYWPGSGCSIVLAHWLCLLMRFTTTGGPMIDAHQAAT